MATAITSERTTATVLEASNEVPMLTKKEPISTPAHTR
jgi:hypothetical protein